MKFYLSTPNLRSGRSAAVRQYLAELRRAEIFATDRAAKEAQADLQQTIRSVGLGRLAGAVGMTSTKRGAKGDAPVGVIYARGGDESLGGGALEAYSRGATITANNHIWLAIATKALPKSISLAGRRFRMTPELYRAGGQALGPLRFKPIGPNRAILVASKVSVSPKTGRAKPLTGRTRGVPQKEVVAFVLIRVTVRAKRFDKDARVKPRAIQVPVYISEYLDRLESRRA